MNLHEECLLKYLLNPSNLLQTTELLKLNNSLIEKNIANANFGNKKPTLSCGINMI